MTTWNYRIVRERTEHGYTFALHEVYYNQRGKITSWSAREMSPFGETLPELLADIKHMLEAWEYPVLTLRNGRLRR